MSVWSSVLSDTTTRISKASGERVGSANDPLVEPSSAPDLAGDECTAQDANEETQSNQALRARNKTGHNCGKRSGEQKPDKDQARTEAITEWASDESDEESRNQQSDHVDENGETGALTLPEGRQCLSWPHLVDSCEDLF